MLNSQWYWVVGIMLVWAGTCACLGGRRIFWEYDEYKEPEA